MMYKYEHGGDIYTEKLTKDGRPFVDYSANINPLGLPLGIKQAVQQALKLCINYPDPFCRELAEVTASYLQLLQVVDDVQEAGGSRVLRDGEVTNDSQVQLVGKATAGSTIIITDVGGVQLGTVKADANGNWEFTPTSSLSDGAH
ncbi:Ig-like domain-containing protein, partial [Phascolarctobacterium succinatutens]|uniref:Ig-like domain-containing protein n=1 Tax=Phascolarctobacterium succinatutens TaxID=626940 RepID=UPI0026F022C7